MTGDYSPQTILDFLPDAVIVSDTDGIITSVNARAVQLFGYSSSELLGLPIDELVPEDQRAAHRNFRHSYYDTLTVRPMGAGRHLLGRRKDGSTFPVEISLSPYTIPGGALVIAIVRDMTERVQLEEAIQEGEQRYRTLLDQSPEPIIVHSMGTIVYANDAVLSFYRLTSRDEMVGKSFLDFVPAEHVEEIRERMRMFPAADMSRMTRLIKTAGFDGKTIFVEVIAARIMYRGQPAAQIILRDMTARIEQEEELRRSREELRDLSSYLQSARETERAAIARELHDELGSALTALKMDLASLEEAMQDETGAESRETRAERLASMALLIDDTVHTMRRIVTELRPALLDSLGLIAAIEWHAEEFQKRTGIPCRLGPHPEDIVIDKDRATSVFRIFQETLTNVVRHAQATEVDVTITIGDDLLTLRVRDNGRGIRTDELNRPHSFGLLGMRERALIHRGEVAIDGSPGEGTTVTLRLPLENAGEGS